MLKSFMKLPFSFSNLFFVIFIIILTNLGRVYGQEYKDMKTIYNAYDLILGEENLKLHKGPLFIDKYIVNNENHRYYISSNLIKGTVVYDGDVFFDQKIKYDLFEDKLLLNPKKSSETLIVELIKSNVDSFSIKGKVFKIFKGNNLDLSIGYLEVLANESNSQLLKKNSKNNQGKTYRNIYYEFKPRYRYYVYHKKLLSPFNSKSDVLVLYPEQNKFIKQFFRGNKTLRKTNENLFIQNLFLELNNKLTNL
jgi:hypothetical protein